MTALLEAIAARSIGRDRLVSSGLPPNRIDQLLSDSDPSVEEVRILSRHLHIPVRELLVRVGRSHGQDLKYRTNFGRVVPDEAQYEGAIGSYRVNALAPLLGESSLPFFSDFPKTLSGAEELAVMFRENLIGLNQYQSALGLNELLFVKFNVVQLMSKFRSIDGMAARSKGAAVILLAERHVGRMRFTFCHEICHLLTDLTGLGTEVWFDQNVIHERRGPNFTEESFANAFAAACLLPPGGVARALKAWRAKNKSPADGLTALEIMHVARSFGVSFDVAGSRLEALKVAPPGATATLKRAILEEHPSAEAFARHFGLAADPGERWQEVARASVGECSDRIRAGSLSLERAAELFALPVQDVLVIGDVYRYN